jgi:hypothetical protein
MGSVSSSRIQCFWLEPTELGRSSLRRYENHPYDPMPPPSCPENRMRYHDTDVVLGDIPYPFGTADSDPTPEDIPHDDPRWPKACDVCGTPFKDDDHWQHNVHRLYRGSPDGKLYSLRDAPPGAMYAATWYPKKGPDGIALHVCLPPGGGDDYWFVDGSASNGPGWTRTGTVPLITARPSIMTKRYHGFLTDGFLVEC